MNTYVLPTARSVLAGAILLIAGLAFAEDIYLPPPDESSADDVEIIAGEDRTIYEYRTNGILMMIKVVPKNGRPYYMVPADGSPHFRSLDHSKKLYPQWVILEW